MDDSEPLSPGDLDALWKQELDAVGLGDAPVIGIGATSLVVAAGSHVMKVVVFNGQPSDESEP